VSCHPPLNSWGAGFDKEFDGLLLKVLCSTDDLIAAVANDLEELSKLSQPAKRKPVEVAYDPINNLLAFRAVSKIVTAKHRK
jgi:hypothetical protein